MLNRISFSIIFILFFSMICVAKEQRKALIFDIGKTEGKPRFIQDIQIEDQTESKKTWTSQIVDADGKVLMTEIAKIENDKVIYQMIEQRQINEVYELNSDDKKATFATYKLVDGKKSETVETNTVDLDSAFIMGPTTEKFLQNKWPDLITGNTVKVDFGIFEVSKLVGFKFNKAKETDSIVQIRMNPSSFFISMLVEPIYIEFDKSKKRMVRFTGRTPLREKIYGKWKPIDAEILYPQP